MISLTSVLTDSMFQFRAFPRLWVEVASFYSLLGERILFKGIDRWAAQRELLKLVDNYPFEQLAFLLS